MSSWLRGIVKPKEGFAISYVDWEQQEFGIAAALSKDPAMIASYESGDCYLDFAKQTGQVPHTATKATHPKEREQCKQCMLGVQYFMAAKSLAARLRQPEIVARHLLTLHRELYKVYWKWVDDRLDSAMLNLHTDTVFGWRQNVPVDPNYRSLGNFPMQANGAEMLRLACCMATEAGIQVVAPVHDAVLMMATIDQIDADVERLRAIMADASAVVLGGFRLRTEAAVFKYPERYRDKKGAEMWDNIVTYL